MKCMNHVGTNRFGTHFKMDAGGEAAAPAEELEVNAVAVAEAELVVAVLVQELTGEWRRSPR